MILITLISLLLALSPAAQSTYPETEPSTVQDKKVKKTETVTFKVSMHCKRCVNKITDNISFIKGVEDLKVSLDQKTVVITYNPAKTDEATLQKAIEKLGYTAEKVQEEQMEHMCHLGPNPLIRHIFHLDRASLGRYYASFSKQYFGERWGSSELREKMDRLLASQGYAYQEQQRIRI